VSRTQVRRAAIAGGRRPPRRPNGRPWTKAELGLLGTLPDEEIAGRIGRTATAVRVKRLRRKIATPATGGGGAREGPGRGPARPDFRDRGVTPAPGGVPFREARLPETPTMPPPLPASSRRRLAASLLATLAGLYLPFTWLLVMDYPWNGYRLHWLKLGPALPGFLAGVPFHPRHAHAVAAMAVATALVAAGLTYLGTRCRRGPLVAGLLAAAVSVPNAVVAYAAFRA
jgi:hypothetical protein